MGKLKKCLCLLIAVVFLAAVVPTVALADGPTPTSIYVSDVSKGGSDSNSGTKESPYATLARAAEVIKQAEGKAYTIYIMSDLTMTESARFWDKDVSIQSDPEKLKEEGKTAFTLSRAETGFVAVIDSARGGYNPALIEIGNGGDLTLSNIILDDGHYAAYSENSATVPGHTPYFVQVDASRSGNGEDGLKPGSTTVNGIEVDNHEIVQDAMIASYDSNSTITLGTGTILQNYGGMSAVRVTGSSKLVMESGSKICDTDSTYIRSKGEKGSNGPAGAVWIQNGTIEMKDGAEISNLNGRAIYVDGGTVTMNGSINNITGNANMWQGQAGIAIHLRGGANVVLGSTSDIFNIFPANDSSTSEKIIFLCTTNVSLTVENGAKIHDSKGYGISVVGTPNNNDPDNIKIEMNGEIYKITGNAMHLNESDGTTCTIGTTGYIHDNNVSYGSLTVQGVGTTVHLYGKINNNYSSDMSGGIVFTNNFGPHHLVMYDGAEVCGNITENDGAGILISRGTFIMKGGTISNNYSLGQKNNSDGVGAGVYVRRGGSFTMENGIISNNVSHGAGGGVAVITQGFGNITDCKVDLQGGQIIGNLMEAQFSQDSDGKWTYSEGTDNEIAVLDVEKCYGNSNQFLTIGNQVTLDEDKIFFEKYNFSIERPAEGVKFGNAAAACEEAVTGTGALESQNLTEVVGSMWYQNETGKDTLPLTVYDLTENEKYDADKDLYAAVVDTNADGTPVENASVSLYAVDVSEADGSFDLLLPGKAQNGTAVVFLQAADDATANIITLKPVNLTAYMGGDQGYDAVVDGNGQIVESTNSLPHPLFTVTDVKDATGMVFSEAGTSKKWTLVKDGTGYYHFSEGDGQDRVRVTYTNDTTGEITLSDSFKLEDVGEMFNTYTVALYTGDVDMSQVTASLNNTNYAVALGTGTLTVRAVQNIDPTTPILITTPADPVATGSATAVVPTGTTYTLNGLDGVTIPSDAVPSLLFDDIIASDDKGDERKAALKAAVDETLGGAGNDRNYEYKYLDLIDANNGNAWIKASNNVTIYWGYPQGTDENTTFKLIHFKNLHRDTSGGAASGIKPSDITAAATEIIDVKTTDQGITFEVTPGNFSPYVLVWEDNTTPGPGPDPTPTPDPEEPELERGDHYAYIFGYEDDTIRPDNDITRAEVATIFYRLLTDASRDEYRTTDNDFTDVSADAWYNETVSTLANAGVLAGYEDGSFRPDAPITRAEYAAIATRFDDLAAGTSSFTDISGHWAEAAINAAYSAGWVGGYEDGTFRPDQNITRAEAMALINRVLERAVDSDGMLDDMQRWVDCHPDAWYYADVQEATNSHDYEREEGEKYETWTELLPNKVF